MRFNFSYFILTLVFLLIEIAIALWVRDAFVRPYLGDFLVVILLYCFVRAFSAISYKRVALAVLVFSFVIEITQYFNFVEVLGLNKKSWAGIILGSSFSWEDLLCYTMGILLVIWVENRMKNR